jgi:hypothetical protein
MSRCSTNHGKGARSLYSPPPSYSQAIRDEFRHAIENIPPAHYLESSYYEHWMYAFEEVLLKRGIVTRSELDARMEQLRQEAN